MKERSKAWLEFAARDIEAARKLVNIHSQRLTISCFWGPAVNFMC